MICAAKDVEPVPHYWLGKIALELRGTDRAIAHLNTAISGKTNMAEAYRELGLAYDKKRESPKAIEAFEQYRKAVPNA